MHLVLSPCEISDSGLILSSGFSLCTALILFQSQRGFPSGPLMYLNVSRGIGYGQLPLVVNVSPVFDYSPMNSVFLPHTRCLGDWLCDPELDQVITENK